MPEAVKVADEPPHNVLEVLLMLSDGTLFTVTITVAVLEQPKAFVPVTIYGVFEVGETVTLLPDKLPGVQL